MRKKLKILEKVDALKYLSQVNRQQFDERRKYEWQVFIITLTFLVLLSAAKYKGELNITTNPEAIFVLVTTVISILIISIWYLNSIHRRNIENKLYAQKAEDLIERMIKDEKDIDFNILTMSEISEPPKPIVEPISRGLWSLAYQIATIIVFGLASIFVLISEKSH